MVYAIIYEYAGGYEERVDVRGVPSLEKYTDSRIMAIYKKANRIYKVYPDSHCVCLKGENWVQPRES